MLSPAFLARVGVGLAVTTAEQVVALPVRLAGEAVQTYLHVGQRITELAVKGDQVIGAVFPARVEQPSWATFDEDADDLDPVVYGSAHTEDEGGPSSDEDVPTGSIRGRRR